jgi:hypothetical protein
MAVTPRVKSGPNLESKGSASIMRGSAMHNPLTRVQSAVRVTTNCSAARSPRADNVETIGANSAFTAVRGSITVIAKLNVSAKTPAGTVWPDLLRVVSEYNGAYHCRRPDAAGPENQHPRNPNHRGFNALKKTFHNAYHSHTVDAIRSLHSSNS